MLRFVSEIALGDGECGVLILRGQTRIRLRFLPTKEDGFVMEY